MAEPRLKLSKGPQAGPDPVAIDPAQVDSARALSLNFSSEAPSAWYRSYGFDDIRSTTGQVSDAATGLGWTETGWDSLSRMREINRAEELTNFSDQELRSLYRRRASGGRGGGMSGDRNRPTLEEFGLTERPTMLQPDQANTQFGISGHLSWDKPVSSLVAKIQHERKLKEIQHRSTLDRAQGFVDNSVGLGLTMGTAIFDPVGLAIGFVPILGEARYAKLGVTAARFFRGAEAGFVGSLGVEPLIYSAKTQEKADYDMYDSLLNVTFGTIAGGGLFAVGGKMYDGYKAIRSRSHQAALEQAIKQLHAGADVEVGQIAAHGAGPSKPVTVSFENVETPSSTNIKPDPNNPAITTVDSKLNPAARPLDPELQANNPVKEYKPNQDVTQSLTLMDEAVAKGARITVQQVTKALDNAAFKEAVQEATAANLGNKVAFYVRTPDGKVMVVRPQGRGPVSLLTSNAFMQEGTLNMANIGENLKDLLAVHGLSAGENFSVGYKGSYQLQNKTLTHVLEITDAVFDPKMNQNHVMFGPEDSMKGMFAQDPADQVFSDLNPQGKQAVEQAMFDPDTYLNTGDGKYASFAGYDTSLEIENLKQTGAKQGTNEGGFFVDKQDGSSVYVKFQDADHSMNEWIAATLYHWFGVNIPKTTIVTDAGKTIGVASDVLPLKTITPEEFAQLDPAVRREFVKHLMIDAYLGNWDVVGNAPGYNLQQLPSGQVWRIDTGGALLFRAQGAPKGEQFGPKVAEFKTLQDKNPLVFKDISSADVDDAVMRILKVPQQQIDNLVDTAIAHGLNPELGEKLKTTLALRRLDLEATFKEVAAKAAQEQGIAKFSGADQANKYFKQFENEIKTKLSTAEFQAIKSYISSSFGLNTALWKAAGQIPPEYANEVKNLDAALDKLSPTKEPFSVWRGNLQFTTYNAVLQQLGLKTFITNQAMNGQDAWAMLKAAKGHIIRTDGYTSTSFAYSGAKKFHDNKAPMTQILIPENNKVIMAGAVSGFTSEAEVILPRGTAYRIKDVLPPPADGMQPVVILEVVDPNATGPVELPDAEKLKIAKAYGNKASNAADSEPMIGEAKDAMMSTLKGSIDDLGKVNADIESLQMNLDAELANLDPELAAALKSGLDADLKAQTQNQASAEDMHKAAQAAAVCITKGM